MSQHIENRRQFLTSNLTAVGSLALAWLLKQDGLLAEPTRPELAPQRFDLLPKPTPQPPRATAMISLWMQGGPSHLDLFDPKPELNKRDGEKFPGEIKYDNAAQASAKMLGSPWKFAKYGQCGMDFEKRFTTSTPRMISASPARAGRSRRWPYQIQETAAISTIPSPDQIA